jgi:hypothetical protein
MTNPRNLTEYAMRKRTTASNLRQQARATRLPSAAMERQAAELDEEANSVLVLTEPSVIGAGGEVVPAQAPGLPFKQCYIVDTLSQGTDRIAEEASTRRTELLTQPSFNVLPLAIDTAESIQAANSLEKMLAHQLAVCHEAAMRFADKSLSYDTAKSGGAVEAARLMNTSIRLMTAFQDGLMTLLKLRGGGNQTIRIEHVHVNQGGQAVIGNVKTGGPSGGARPQK